MTMSKVEYVVAKTEYLSIDNRVFKNEKKCIAYENWLENNNRNIPTKEQFNLLKAGEEVLYRGNQFILEYDAGKYKEEYVEITDNRWSNLEVHYTELDIIEKINNNKTTEILTTERFFTVVDLDTKKITKISEEEVVLKEVSNYIYSFNLSLTIDIYRTLLIKETNSLSFKLEPLALVFTSAHYEAHIKTLEKNVLSFIYSNILSFRDSTRKVSMLHKAFCIKIFIQILDSILKEGNDSNYINFLIEKQFNFITKAHKNERELFSKILDKLYLLNSGPKKEGLIEAIDRIIKKTYISRDNRTFDNETDLLHYEEWISKNSRNIPTVDEFKVLREGQLIYYKGKEYIVLEKPERQEREMLEIKINNPSQFMGVFLQVHYTEIDLIK